MSGHSHWASIKHKKGAADEKRGKAFSKMAKLITVAAREKGGDPDTNPTLRMAIDSAKKINMPKDNIERAVKKGTGELVGEKLEEVILEAYGPNKIAIILECITDNKNRTLGEVKKILSQYNGKLADEGSVQWLFDKLGEISIETDDKERVELEAIEAGAKDIEWEDNIVYIYTDLADLDKAKKHLESKGFEINSSSPSWIAKDKIEVGNLEPIEKLFNALDDNDDIQNIYSNIQ